MRRAAAVLLSLLAPGAGHVLMGRFARGVGWGVALVLLGVGFVFVLPITITAFLAAVVVAILVRVGAAVDALRLTRGSPGGRAVTLALIAYLAANVLFALFVAAPSSEYYRTHYAQSFSIPSGGMRPALLVGDYVLSDNARYRRAAPARGDIAVFHDPVDGRRNFVKRVIALPGEMVQLRGDEVLVNGATLPEPYASRPGVAPSACTYAYACAPTTVPPDAYFVLGDERDNSQDSRSWGFIRRDQMVGRVFAIYWSWDVVRHWPRFERIGRML